MSPPRGLGALPCVLGDWQLVRPLAQSQHGLVYEACPVGSAEDEPCEYVVKLLPDSSADDARSLAMFRREVCVGGKVDHEHLVPVVDARLGEPQGYDKEDHASGVNDREAAAADSQPCYLVMPRVAGITLEEQLSSPERLGWDQACWIVRQIGQALSWLHGEGWLHADVKPSNVVVAHDGHVTLLDLGFLQPLHTLRSHDSVVHGAAMSSHSSMASGISAAGSSCLIGTLKYIAPEMLTRVGHVTAASDIYSLGILFYELLVGRHPFAGALESQLVRLHMETVPTDVRVFDPTLPESLAELVAAMIAKDSLRRPATADEIVHSLVRLEIAALTQTRVSA